MSLPVVAARDGSVVGRVEPAIVEVVGHCTLAKVGDKEAVVQFGRELGASRQRVNQELKGFERQGAVRVEPTRLVVLSRDKLLAIAER